MSDLGSDEAAFAALETAGPSPTDAEDTRDCPDLTLGDLQDKRLFF